MNVYSMLSACKWEGEGGVCVCVCVWGGGGMRGGAPRLSQWEQSSANVISRRLSSVPELRSAQPWWTSPPTPVSIHDHALTVHRADPGLGSCEVVFCFGCGQPGCLQSRDIAQIKKRKKKKENGIFKTHRLVASERWVPQNFYNNFLWCFFCFLFLFLL